MGTVHIAGPAIQVGSQLRQRCAWCGAVLIDHALDQLMYEATTPPEQRRPATWPVDGLIEVEGGMSVIVNHEDGEQLPPNACAQLDHAVTA
jgi:hypothetical protein